MKLNENEGKVLAVLTGSSDGDCDYGYCGFAFLSESTGLDRKQVRRACRALAKKGLTVFGRGLWTEDGKMAGSGYCATDEGYSALTAAERKT